MPVYRHCRDQALAGRMLPLFLHHFYNAVDSLLFQQRLTPMDVVYIALTVGFFIFSGWLISALSRL